MFSTELTRRGFQASNGEVGWSREDARLAVSILVRQQRAILGGELWWVPDGARDCTGLISQRTGPDAVYPWETTRAAGEEWAQAIERWPAVEDLPTNLEGRILYNLTRGAWTDDRGTRD